jgi:hypothetical protein
MAGVPFDVLDPLSTQATAAAARRLLDRREAVAHEKSGAAARRSSARSMSTPPEPTEAARDLAAAELTFKNELERELNEARTALLEASRRVLPAFLVFGVGGTRLTRSLHAAEAVSIRNARARDHERRLLLYLQRVCSKNDTFSEFGPMGWGIIEGQGLVVQLAPKPGIAKRETFLERWTAHALAAALNSDPEIRAELSPRLHPNGRIEGDQFVFTDSAERIPLAPGAIAVLGRCDGVTPGYRFSDEIGALTQLAALNMIRWEVEVPALDPYAFETIVSDIRAWRAGPVRARWLDMLEPIAALPAKFAQAGATSARAEVMDDARRQFQDLGVARDLSQRFLYAAANPIAEECYREGVFQVSETMIADLAVEAAPWIDLWRDSYAFVASRVAAGLRGVLEKMPVRNGAVPLPAFLRACESAKLSLTGPGLVAIAHMAFQEVKAAFREMMESHAHQAEYELTAVDCHFVREKFQYPKFDEYTFPSADLQISARSNEAVAAGDYQWILAELHPPVALLHHGGYWSCPDKSSLNQALAQTICGKPNFHFGFFAADFTSHTTVRLIDALPDFSNFVAPQRSNSKWRTVAPADAEVYVDRTSGDVGVRTIRSQEHLGSFARAWLIPLGFHPFHFGRAPHMPRLRCGQVIVQRRSWTVGVEELPPGDYTGVSRDLVLAIERLRAEKDWPRYIYTRPTEQALRRSGAEGRDKDTKPVFIDLESYLFLEIFHRWLTKAGELEITEMLPDPDHLLWQEADGRRTFELRTQIVPG